jgi:hypothetical protein
MTDKFPAAVATGSEFLPIKLLEKTALLIRDLPIAHHFGLPVYPTACPRGAWHKHRCNARTLRFPVRGVRIIRGCAVGSAVPSGVSWGALR